MLSTSRVQNSAIDSYGIHPMKFAGSTQNDNKTARKSIQPNQWAVFSEKVCCVPQKRKGSKNLWRGGLLYGIRFDGLKYNMTQVKFKTL
jgi:hypothetical protein